MGIVGVSRRMMLGATAVLGVGILGGCGGTEWYPANVTPDEYVLRAVIREKERMIARYEAAISEGSGSVELLERFLEHHLAHLDALSEALPEDTALAEPDASPPADEEPPAHGLDAAELGVLEAAATSARLDQAGAVTDPGLAQLLGSIGACEAGHAHLLAQA